MINLVSKANFSRMCGISRPAVTKLTNTKLKDAVIDGQINLENPIVKLYVQEKGKINIEEPIIKIRKKIKPKIKPNAKQKVKHSKKPAPKSDSKPYTSPHDPRKNIAFEDIRDILKLTLSEIVRLYGTKNEFMDWIKSTKDIERIHELRLKNAREEKVLISRDIIKKGVVEPFDRAHNLLLSDGVKTITTRLTLMINAGRTKEDCEKFVTKQISNHIKIGKDDAIRTLEGIDK